MDKFITYIEESIAKLQQEENMLISSDRKDEANLVKIRINIYGICRTILQVIAKEQSAGRLAQKKELERITGEQAAQEPGTDRWKEAYLQKLDALPQNWKASYDKAKEHNDVEKLVIEEIKLETLQAIRCKFQEIYDE